MSEKKLSESEIENIIGATADYCLYAFDILLDSVSAAKIAMALCQDRDFRWVHDDDQFCLEFLRGGNVISLSRMVPDGPFAVTNTKMTNELNAYIKEQAQNL
ncbi:hypothetical protein A3C09_02220 [Candidatus Uhrbacteria bacterium RIFCSPHIGHO2_02_FULL_47_44]|uniref:Uncharacterized protein n=1 Tax=Candidatus Uhrbacteria bacterium RIFCSPLOWO2_02_FULL_48_18 TaxID=1802408 RepID=A0A1F7V884_9BACT|nr:MAG: hypothetical protein A3C09_02220 [Candidatus Uhrbacteria bacterium RIFCSPHIGHO2_02_FULL_47_44]OGL77596.1 MAG: hypothetical protein A3E97_04945 [Candidatus Uhrbacteria bacterium RIFCSPHIGHO2_12_FULL_47_12]OGL80418.1 MAG: hypothetical protein A3B20_03315 [Candidatus Uhrbacteria bacterium RIFCSPLOWO2_01_FULL_47_17]OGL86278.1 MAG: hypothetical protein A3I41_01800 [Candidatus Uhrbacteria bacterium RIFCSPLOWO2_02_FULL_48_18]